MARFPIFLSVILVLRNESETLEGVLRTVTNKLAGLAQDYELIVVDNASADASLTRLRALTESGGLPNLQVFALSKEVDIDTAISAGLENALGDFVAVLDPFTDDAGFLPDMLEAAAGGQDVVYATNLAAQAQSLSYRLFSFGFNALYRLFTRVHLTREAPLFRVMNRRVVNFILRHPRAAIAYRALPATGGFARTRLTYRTDMGSLRPKNLSDSIDRGIRLLVSTTRGPMRLVTLLCLFGAVANLLYCGYVIAVFFWKPDVAPGWVTLSLQQSGMFFLISLVLLVLGEYILQMASFSAEGQPYSIAQEFTSAELSTDRGRLNIEEVRARTSLSA